MKKTQWIELFYNIRHTIVSFTAIIIFVALATGLFTGIKWAVRSISLSVEAAYSRDSVHHFSLSYPYGFSEEFADSLKNDETISEAEGYYETFRSIRTEDDRFLVKIVSLTRSTDRPLCVEGRLPEKEGEAAVNRFFAEEHDISVGDVISFEEGGSSLGFYLNAIASEDPKRFLSVSGEENELTTDSFTVTALVDSAEYLGVFSDVNGISPDSPAPVKTVLYIAETSFNKEAFCGYPKLVLRAKELDGLSTNSDEYGERSALIEKKITAAVQDYTSQKYASLRASSEHMKAELGKFAVPGSDYLSSPALSVLDNIRDYDAFIETRPQNGSFVGISYISKTFERMQYSLVSLFVAIEILVCYSTVSRLVYDQSVLIGTKKAMGFSTGGILKSYLLYSIIAVLSGVAAGTLLGRLAVEPIAVSGVRSSYRFDRVVYYTGVMDILAFAAVQAALILAAALIASVSASRRKPLDLLTGARSVSGKRGWFEKLPVWKRLSLLHKTVIKNCLDDRRRVFGTLVGIAGCTVLVVCALSTQENLSNSFSVTMKKICTYDATVCYGGAEKTHDGACSLLNEAKISHISAHYILGTIRSEDGRRPLTSLYAADDDGFYDFIHLRDIDDGTERKTARGAWINSAYAKNFGASVGDDICFIDSSGQNHVFTIEGIYEYYLINYQIIIPSSLYEEAFGVKYEPNTILLRGADSVGNIKNQLLDLDKSIFVNDFYKESKSVFDSFVGVCRVMVVVYLVLSVILALLLLLNLFTMFVTEKKKELIILMINGYSRKEAEKYISTDTKFLAAVGIAVGVGFGILMGALSLESFNNDATNFLNRVSPAACLIGILFSAVLVYVMCRIALRKVRHFKLSDIGTM